MSKNESPDDVVMTAYHMLKAAAYVRDADAELGLAVECMKEVVDATVSKGNGEPGERYMDLMGPFGEIHALRSLLATAVSRVQQSQCAFNVEVLGNEPVTRAQLLKYGGGGR